MLARPAWIRRYKGAGQGRLQDKSSGKSYPIQTNDGVDCQSLNQGSP